VDAGRQFAEVGLDAVASDTPASAETLAAHIAAQTAWVAECGGEIVGYAVASVVDEEAHLDQVSVQPLWQGRGIGRMLIERVASWGRDAQLPSLTLTTFVHVPWNAPYYARLGFAVLTSDELGPELRAIRDGERWLDELQPRVAMRRSLRDQSPGPS
jgi:GNAT superfamily N-acetyltransferase